MGRAPCCDKANVKKGPWSSEEDSKLKDYIHNYGTGGNWIALPLKAGLKRCGKSCRLRWLNYLRPNIKHGQFSHEEDTIICTLFANIGSRWSVIASQLPGRTDNDIKNYWNTKLKKKLMHLLPSPPPPPPPPPPTTTSFHQGIISSSSSNYYSLLPPAPTSVYNNMQQSLYINNNNNNIESLPNLDYNNTINSYVQTHDHQATDQMIKISNGRILHEEDHNQKFILYNNNNNNITQQEMYFGDHGLIPDANNGGNKNNNSFFSTRHDHQFYSYS